MSPLLGQMDVMACKLLQFIYDAGQFCYAQDNMFHILKTTLNNNANFTLQYYYNVTPNNYPMEMNHRLKRHN